MSNQLTSQLSSDSSPGQASSLGIRPSHDAMLTSPPASKEDNKDGYEPTAGFISLPTSDALCLRICCFCSNQSRAHSLTYELSEDGDQFGK